MKKQEEKRFSFAMPIMKCYEEKKVDENGKEEVNRFIEGVASSTDLDLHGDKMSPDAIKTMAKSIKDHVIGLNAEHDKSWQSDLGDVTTLTVDKKHRLVMKARLDITSKAKDLWYALTKKKKELGLSIGGYVKDYQLMWDKKREVFYRVFKDIELDHIAVTSTPANPKTWVNAIAKSVDKVEKASELADINLAWSFSEEEADAIIKKGGWAMYKKCHALVKEEGTPENKSAYELPYRKLVKGELKTVWRGVTVAMAALLGITGKNVASETERKAVYTLLSKQYKKFGKDVPVFRNFKDMDAKALFSFINLALSDMDEGQVNELLTNFKLMKKNKKSLLESDELKKTVDASEEEVKTDDLDKSETQENKDSDKSVAKDDSETEAEEEEVVEGEETEEEVSEGEDTKDAEESVDEEEEEDGSEEDEAEEESDEDSDEDAEEKTSEEKDLSKDDVQKLIDEGVAKGIKEGLKALADKLLGKTEEDTEASEEVEEKSEEAVEEKSEEAVEDKAEKSEMSEVVDLLKSLVTRQDKLEKSIGNQSVGRKTIALEKDEAIEDVDGNVFKTLEDELADVRKRFPNDPGKAFVEAGKVRSKWAE